jgi:hypothetical protein
MTTNVIITTTIKHNNNNNNAIIDQATLQVLSYDTADQCMHNVRKNTD